jgi:general secretion pathway protein A
MYESFYGLREKPFKILPDPGYLYMSQGHENAYVHLEYGIRENKGFVVITGEIGSGKTTLINYLLKKIDQNIQVGLINTTQLNPLQFIRILCQDFELEVDGLDKAEMIVRFYDFLIRKYREGRRVMLIIDEAQNLPSRTMEELRMLSNLQSEKHHLLHIVMVGQPELRKKLQRPELQQFAQRVSVYYHLGGLRPEEVVEYLRHRIGVAGGEAQDVFDRGAVKAIASLSRGIPRIINVICDMSMVYGFADGIERIGANTVASAVKEQGLDGGLLRGRGEDGKNEITSSKSSQDVATGIKAIQKHLILLEEQVQEIDEKLSVSPFHSNRGYKIWADLIKTLKISIESRQQTLFLLEKSEKKLVDQRGFKKRKKFWFRTTP